LRAGVLSPSSTPIRFGSSCAASRAATFLPVHEEGEAAMAARKNSPKKDTRKDAGAGPPAELSWPGDDGTEVAEERTEVVRYAAAIDVAKGFGMVCTRVPGSRPDHKRQKVWRAEASVKSSGSTPA